jgi:hypothetical protein
MAKTVKELQAALAKEYAGPTFEKEGRTYIPWNEAVKVANEVFGLDGYDIETREVRREGEGFMAVVRVTAYPTDGRPVSRDGVGYNDLLQTKAGKELTDMSIKGAASDALNRAFKLFGPAFGLSLYDKEPNGTSAAKSSNSNGASRSSSSNGGGSSKWADKPATEALSEKQLWVLVNKLGVSDEELEGMTAGEAKAILDKGMGGGNGKAAAPAGKSRRVTTPDEDEDDLF